MLDEQLNLIEAKNCKYTVGDMKAALSGIGIHSGDDICVHSQIFSFGKPLLPKKEFLDTLIRLLLEQIGETGTLIMPTFTYSFCKQEKYMVSKTPSTVGILTEAFRTYPGAQRTCHPIFSFAVMGKRAEEYLDIGPDAFGHDSVYGKMMRNHGKYVLFGANVAYTACYLPEEHVSVSYRYFKEFKGIIQYADGSERRMSIPYYVRDLNAKQSDLSEDKVARFLLETGIQRQVTFGKGTIGAFEIKQMYDEFVVALRTNQYQFLK